MIERVGAPGRVFRRRQERDGRESRPRTRRRSAGSGRDRSLFFSSRRRHTRYWRDWSSDVCSSDLAPAGRASRHPPLARLAGLTMPISSFYGLQTSLRGLLAQQRSLDVTGHNIANASTKGYSRQEALLAPSDPLVIPAGATQTGSGAHLGSGVDVQQYRRTRDQFLDLQYRGQAIRADYESTHSGQLDRVEVSLSEPGEEGIAAQLAQFWSAWNDLATAPQDNGARTALIEQGSTLAEAFLTVDRQLAQVAEQARQEFDGLTAAGGEVESIARDIASLNATIRTFVSSGDDPNDLYVRRELLINPLASLWQVITETLPDGSMRVAFGGGVTLVDPATVAWPGGGALTAPDGMLGGLKALFEPG